jgi:hypothetical protein
MCSRSSWELSTPAGDSWARAPPSADSRTCVVSAPCTAATWTCGTWCAVDIVCTQRVHSVCTWCVGGISGVRARAARLGSTY